MIAYVQEGALVGERFPWRDVLEAASDDPRSKPEVLDEVERLMAAYFAFWGEENAGWQEEARIIKIENKLEVAADVLGPLPYTARADCMLEIGGTIVVPDHKTRSRSIPDGEKRDKFLKQKQTNPQFLGLSYLVQKTYELDEPPDILLNAIVKTKIPKFQRVRVRFSQAQIDRWAKAQARDARDLDFEPVRPLDLVPMNYVSCAPELGAPCSYFDFCHAKSEAAAWKHFEIAGDFGDPESEEE